MIWRGYEIWQIDGGRYLPERALHITLPIPVISLVAEALPDLAPARQIAFLQTIAVAAAMLAFGASLFWIAERRRVLARLNAELENRVAVRTAELTRVNADLKRTQADLVQAEKLSALGHMSAGISHGAALDSSAIPGDRARGRGAAEPSDRQSDDKRR